MYPSGQHLVYEDWQGVMREGYVRESGRDVLIVTRRLTDKHGRKWRIHETIGLEQIRDYRHVAA